jgi:hypothetical protein
VYVFERAGTSWTQQTKLQSEGAIVALEGDTAVVSRADAAVYVLGRTAGVWSRQAKITDPEPSPDRTYFGNYVALSGNTLAVSAPSARKTANAPEAGLVWVFTRTGTTWGLEAKLSAPDGARDDGFGQAVAVAGDILLAGATGDDTPAGVDVGSVYVFSRSGTAWSLQSKLLSPVGYPSGNFGGALAFAGDTALAAAYFDAAPWPLTGDRTYTQGRVFAFKIVPSTPSLTAYYNWIAKESGDLDPAAAPFGDGVPNVIKYAFNMDSSGPDRRTLVPGTGKSGLPVFSWQNTGGAASLRVEYIRRTAGGLLYNVVKSRTMAPGSWEPLTAQPAVTPIDSAWERVVYLESVDPDTDPNLFARIEVTLP